jgi:hypothetical protein
LGEMLRKMNVKYFDEQYVNLNTGKRIDLKDPLVTHGFDID